LTGDVRLATKMSNTPEEVPPETLMRLGMRIGTFGFVEASLKKSKLFTVETYLVVEHDGRCS
jgi:hypothetical protein